MCEERGVAQWKMLPSGITTWKGTTELHQWTADDFNSFAHHYFNCVSFISHNYTDFHCLKFCSFLYPPDGKYAALPQGEMPHCCRWQGGVRSEHQIHPPGTSDIYNATSSVSAGPPPPACHHGQRQHSQKTCSRCTDFKKQ